MNDKSSSATTTTTTTTTTTKSFLRTLPQYLLAFKKLHNIRPDVPLEDRIPKTCLPRSVWPQKAVLQACYGRNFHLEPSLLMVWQMFGQNMFSIESLIQIRV